MNKTKEKNKMKAGWYFLIAFAILVIQPFLVHLFLKIQAPCDFLVRYWNAGDLITYIAGFEAAIGTIVLGCVTLEINKRLLSIEERRDAFDHNPCIVIKDLDYRDNIKLNSKIIRNSYYSNYMNSRRVATKSVRTRNKVRIPLVLLNTSQVFTKVSYDLLFVMKMKVPIIEQSLSDGDKFFPPNTEIPFTLAVDSKYMSFGKVVDCKISLSLTTNLGEKFNEELFFKITNNIDGFKCYMCDIKVKKI